MNRASDHAVPMDVVTREVVWTRLISIADEMAAGFRRVAFSPVVREIGDFSCVLLDSRGGSVAQATVTIPSFAATLPPTTRHLLRRFPAESLRDGDVLITNDPYLGTGHLPDITIVTPVFSSGPLIGFTGTIFHSADIGGRPCNAEAMDMFEEGLRIPPSKLYEAGVLNETLWELISANVRIPDQVGGDIQAVVASNHLAGLGVTGVLDEMGLSALDPIADAIQDYSEGIMRQVLSDLPDGDYEGETTLDGGEEPTYLHLTLRIRGDEAVLDFAGSSPQSPIGINCVPTYAYGYSVYPLKCAVDPSTPNNEGSFRPVSFTAPEGSIVNPIPPVPVNARGLTGHGLQACVFEALSQIVPDKVQADSGTPVWVLIINGEREEGHGSFVGTFFLNGGQGAKRSEDGLSCISFPACVYNTPVEVFEQELPLRIDRREIIPDSGGLGRTRGGCGQRVSITNVSSMPVDINMMTERQKFAAKGLEGGLPGRAGAIYYTNGREVSNPKGRNQLYPGETIVFETPGGGGFGPPAERSREVIAADIEDGYVRSWGY